MQILFLDLQQPLFNDMFRLCGTYRIICTAGAYKIEFNRRLNFVCLTGYLLVLLNRVYFFQNEEGAGPFIQNPKGVSQNDRQQDKDAA